MRLLVYGAGAVGGYVGGKLAAAGHDVVCLGRLRVAEAINARGLVVQDGGRGTVAPQRGASRRARAVTSAAEAFSGALDAPFDFVIFAMKSSDTAAAIEELRPVTPQPPPVLCLQNGVDNEPALAGAFGAERVIPGTLTTAVSTDEPGVITVERERGIGLALGHPLAPKIAEAFDGAGLLTVRYPAAQAEALKWTKLLTNLIANATSAITDMTPEEVYAHPRLFRLEIAMLRECLAVMQAMRLSLVNLPRLRARPLGLLLRYLPPATYQSVLRGQVGGGRGGKMPSFHAALNSGRAQTEVEWLHGAVARRAEQVGTRAPVCRMLTETLTGITEGRLAWEDFRKKPEALLKRLA